MKEIPNCDGYFATKDGRIYSNKTGPLKEKKQTTASVGYNVVGLTVNGEEFVEYVHRLIIKTYKGNPNYNEEVRHLDGDRLNNNISNLAYGTRSENVQDMIKHGNATIGHKNKQAIFNKKDVVNIRSMLESGYSVKDLSKNYNCSISTIRRIKNNKTYQNV